MAVACFFRNAAFVRWRPDAARWPKTAAWIDRTLATPAFAKLAVIEDAILRVPIPEQRARLQSMGVAISRETFGMATPRRGVMPL